MEDGGDSILLCLRNVDLLKKVAAVLIFLLELISFTICLYPLAPAVLLHLFLSVDLVPPHQQFAEIRLAGLSYHINKYTKDHENYYKM
jgi:hypothetical protein